MMQRSEIVKGRTELPKENHECEKEKLKFSILFEKYGDNCVICNKIPANTEEKDLRMFFTKFGELQYLWLEEPNGEESLQSLIVFSTFEAFQKTISDKIHNFKGIDIEVEPCNVVLKNMAAIIHFLNQQEDDIELQKQKIQILTQENITLKINIILKKINKEREAIKAGGGIISELTSNDLLLTKFACDILHRIISIEKYIANEQICQKDCTQELFRLVGSIPLHQICPSHIRALLTLSMYLIDFMKKELLKNKSLQTLSQLLQHSNLDIRNDALTIMKNLIQTQEIEIFKKSEHFLFKEMEQDGIIDSLAQNSLLNGRTELMKNNASLIIGVLYRTQNIKPDLRKLLIDQLKKGVQQDNDQKNISDLLDVLSGFAINKCMFS